MKIFIVSSLFLGLVAYAFIRPVTTPDEVNSVAQSLGGNIDSQTPLPANPSVNPVPDVNTNESVINNPTIGPYIPPRARQSQEERPVFPGQPSAYPPVNNPGLPSNVDRSGRPVIP